MQDACNSFQEAAQIAPKDLRLKVCGNLANAQVSFCPFLGRGGFFSGRESAGWKGEGMLDRVKVFIRLCSFFPVY
jgi:hypothetical protein